MKQHYKDSGMPKCLKTPNMKQKRPSRDAKET
jgi:hypothetical protein